MNMEAHVIDSAIYLKIFYKCRSLIWIDDVNFLKWIM